MQQRQRAHAPARIMQQQPDADINRHSSLCLCPATQVPPASAGAAALSAHPPLHTSHSNEPHILTHASLPLPPHPAGATRSGWCSSASARGAAAARTRRPCPPASSSLGSTRSWASTGRRTGRRAGCSSRLAGQRCRRFVAGAAQAGAQLRQTGWVLQACWCVVAAAVCSGSGAAWLLV